MVRFYDERTGGFIETDQPVSVLSGSTDDVFVDWTPEGLGDHPVAVRVIPWNESGDDPANNKAVANIYASLPGLRPEV